jgi:hypothetical protein
MRCPTMPNRATPTFARVCLRILPLVGFVLASGCRSSGSTAPLSGSSAPDVAVPPVASVPVSASAPASTPSTPVALLGAIALDIEALGPRYPQLAGFRAAQNFDRGRLVIEYAHHTHPSTHRGGWTSGVPNPDADGIWLYVDLHGADSMAQIHTQPMVPMLDVLGQKLMMLLLEGEATRPAAGALQAILENRARGAAKPRD